MFCQGTILPQGIQDRAHAWKILVIAYAIIIGWWFFLLGSLGDIDVVWLGYRWSLRWLFTFIKLLILRELTLFLRWLSAFFFHFRVIMLSMSLSSYLFWYSLNAQHSCFLFLSFQITIFWGSLVWVRKLLKTMWLLSSKGIYLHPAWWGSVSYFSPTNVIGFGLL
jgi:hypothetical protein